MFRAQVYKMQHRTATQNCRYWNNTWNETLLVSVALAEHTAAKQHPQWHLEALLRNCFRWAGWLLGKICCRCKDTNAMHFDKLSCANPTVKCSNLHPGMGSPLFVCQRLAIWHLHPCVFSPSAGMAFGYSGKAVMRHTIWYETLVMVREKTTVLVYPWVAGHVLGKLCHFNHWV